VKNLVRSLLVWLMLLALPFQGIASAAMLTCAHATMRSATPLAAAMPAMQHDASAAEGHCHSDEAPTASTASHHDGDAHDHDGRCSACADCCVGALLAPAPALLAAPPDAPAVIHPAAAGRLAAVDLALPERPPRFPLA
jgi:hypothetical protein